MTAALARFFRRRGAVVLALLVLAAATTLLAGRSTSPSSGVASESALPSAKLPSVSAQSPRGLHASGFAATRARRGRLPKRTILTHPRKLFLTAAHSRVFDVRKLKGKVVKRERPEVGAPNRERGEVAARSAVPTLPKTLPPKQVQAASANAAAPAPSASFEGLDFANWGKGHPPDTNGDVGPSYYIQTINTSIGIYDKSTGTRVAGFTFNAFMSQGSFGNLCDTDNFGDPVVLYDSFENRWFITDFAFVLDGAGNINPQHVYQCFAVSKTSDPVAGGWNFYSLEAPGGIDDYPKFGVWPDGIYMSANMFGYAAGASFTGTHVLALNKAQMYAGEPTVQVVDFQPPSSDFTLLPANARLQAGTPPLGAPEYFVSTWQYLNALTVYKLHVDWDKISTSTFTGPDIPINATSWPNQSVLNAPTPGNPLDTLQIRAMAQAQYSNLGGAESLWVAHTVRRVLNGAAAPRWYQVNVTGGAVAANTLQGVTWDPDGADTFYRYMPSLAVDRNGDLALGYSKSNSATNPQIKYAGRLGSDAVNTFSQTEQTLIDGTGTQTGLCGSSTCTRWGDYSGMALDPNGCDFWITNEYYAVNGLDHHTRIGAFQFPGCTTVGNGTLSGTVTDGTNPIAGVTLRLGSRTTTTDDSGNYSFTVPAGTYPSLTASKPGYDSASASSIAVPDGGTATRNFALSAAATTGCFTDNTQNSFQRGLPSNCDLVANPGSVQLTSQAVVDQKNETLGNVGNGITTTTYGGQTFTPAVSGPLAKADINLFCSGCTGTTPNLTLSVRATSGGLPTGGDLATATIPGFSSGAANWYTGTFASPLSVTAGTQYALVIRPTALPVPGTYALTRSGTSTAGADVYAGGARVTGTSSGTVWSIPTTGGVTTDAGFRAYVNTGYAASGTFVSSLKDANPAAGRTPTWTTLSFSATKPAGTDVKFQVAASNSSFGPFAYVGPDGTASTFFTTSGASLSQFNGFRYLRYKAYLSTTDSTVTPSISSVSACFADVLGATPTALAVDPAGGTFGGTTNLSATLTTGDTGLGGKSVGFTLNGSSVGSATTNGSGVATLSGVSLAGIDAASYPSGVGASFAGDSSYAASNGSATLTIGKADQLISITTHAPSSAAYGASFGVAATGGGSGNPVTFSNAGVCSNAGGTFTMTSGTGTCTVKYNQNGNGNYNAAPQLTESVTAQKAGQTIDFPAISDFTWQGGSATLHATAGSGLAVSYSIVSGPCAVSAGVLTADHAGSCVVAADQAGDSNFDPATQVTKTATVLKADQSITVTTHAPSSAVYGTGFSVAASGGGSGNPVTFSSGGACSNTGATFTMTSGTGTCSVEYDQAGDADYKAATQVSESVDAQKASQSISVTTHAPSTAVYGSGFSVAASGGDSGNAVTFSSSGACSNTGDSFTMTSGTGTCSVKYDQAGDSNYSAAPQVSESVDAQKADQTISINTHAPASAIYSTSFSVAASGGGSGNAVTFSSGGSCSNAGSFFTMTSGTGTCSVKYDQAGNADYNDAIQVSDSVDAQKAGQSISFDPLPDKTDGDPDFSVSATASSGLAVSFGASGQCSVSGSTVHLTGVGSCTITASQGGDDNFAAAADVPRTFQIANAPEAASQITTKDATCDQFSAGTAQSLASLLYGRKNGKVAAVQPRAFVYWIRVTAVAGTNTFTVDEAITTANFTGLFDVSSGDVYTSNCGAGPRPSVSQGSTGAVTFRFNAAGAGTYYLAVTYKSTSVKGERVPSPTTVHYDFSTRDVSGSTSGLDLSPQPAAGTARPTGHAGRFFWLLRR